MGQRPPANKHPPGICGSYPGCNREKKRKKEKEKEMIINKDKANDLRGYYIPGTERPKGLKIPCRACPALEFVMENNCPIVGKKEIMIARKSRMCDKCGYRICKYHEEKS